MPAHITPERINEIKAGRQVLKTYTYSPVPVDKGYTNKTLYINVSDNSIAEKDITEEMKDKFIGGKGFGLYYLWHAVNRRYQMERPGKRDCHLTRTHRRNHPVSRCRKIASRQSVAHNRQCRRQQCRRPFRSPAEIFRLGCAGTARQGRRGHHHLHQRQ
jgi:hypothetical protein